jgi:hypothetical protein
VIDRGRLSGIIDWKCARFYPEYWGFRKLMYGAERFPEIQQIIREAYSEESYEEELEAKLALWNDTPFGIYDSIGRFSCQSIRYCLVKWRVFQDLKDIFQP